jgi:hypothetical protein
MDAMTSTPTDRSHENVSGILPAADGADFIDDTIAIWQKRSKRALTREDGREIIENMTGFFRVLLEWDRADRAASNDDPATAR